MRKRDAGKASPREIDRILRGMASKRGKKKGSTFGTELGARLRAIRDKRGLTQQQLADRLHTYPPRISQYESGVVVPEAETLAALAQALEVSLDELVFGRPPSSGEDGISDVRLRERVRELEKVHPRFREAAITVIDAFVVQGSHEATTERLQSGGKR